MESIAPIQRIGIAFMTVSSHPLCTFPPSTAPLLPSAPSAPLLNCAPPFTLCCTSADTLSASFHSLLVHCTILCDVPYSICIHPHTLYVVWLCCLREPLRDVFPRSVYTCTLCTCLTVQPSHCTSCYASSVSHSGISSDRKHSDPSDCAALWELTDTER